MKLWLLRPIDTKHDILILNGERFQNPWIPWYNRCFGMIVRAETKEDARLFADTNSADEAIGKLPNPWINPLLTNCDELMAEGIETVIMQDIKQA